MVSNVLRSLAPWIIASAAIMNCDAASAKTLSRLLYCSVSGTGGCGGDEGGICVGAGIKDPAIKMVIDAKRRTVQINGFRGWIEGDSLIDASGIKNVDWR
jgi:hypothetical protein